MANIVGGQRGSDTLPLCCWGGWALRTAFGAHWDNAKNRVITLQWVTQFLFGSLSPCGAGQQKSGTMNIILMTNIITLKSGFQFVFSFGIIQRRSVLSVVYCVCALFNASSSSSCFLFTFEGCLRILDDPMWCILSFIFMAVDWDFTPGGCREAGTSLGRFGGRIGWDVVLFRGQERRHMQDPKLLAGLPAYRGPWAMCYFQNHSSCPR